MLRSLAWDQEAGEAPPRGATAVPFAGRPGVVRSRCCRSEYLEEPGQGVPGLGARHRSWWWRRAKRCDGNQSAGTLSDTFAMARARRALMEAGLDEHAPLERASSVTNEVWLSPDLVIRVNRQPNQRLRREAFLGPILPPTVDYPEVVAYGGQLGADWLIMA